MARPCKVCDDRDHQEIDEALRAGQPYRTVAREHGLTKSALSRHVAEHLEPTGATSPDPEQPTAAAITAGFERIERHLLYLGARVKYVEVGLGEVLQQLKARYERCSLEPLPQTRHIGRDDTPEGG